MTPHRKPRPSGYAAQRAAHSRCRRPRRGTRSRRSISGPARRRSCPASADRRRGHPQDARGDAFETLRRVPSRIWAFGNCHRAVRLPGRKSCCMGHCLAADESQLPLADRLSTLGLYCRDCCDHSVWSCWNLANTVTKTGVIFTKSLSKTGRSTTNHDVSRSRAAVLGAAALRRTRV